MSRLTKICAALAICLGLAAPASATLIYSNPMQTPTTSWFGYAAGDANQFVASSFVLGGAGSASSATWVGSVWTGWPQSTQVTIDFLDSVAGVGNIVATRTVNPTATFIGLNAAGFNTYLYEASFSAVVLAGSTTYHIAINDDSSGNWIWGQSSNTGSQTIFSYGASHTSHGNWGFAETPGRAFDLFGEGTEWTPQLVAAPEPAMVALFGLGLAALGFARRR